MDVNLLLLAVTTIGKEHRFLGLDWSYLDIIGGVGAITFSMRFIVQWLASEKAGESIVPRSFWHWSIAGTVIMLIYFICLRNPIGILLYLPNTCVYLRNLALIKKKEARDRASLLEQESPSEMVNH